MRNSIKKEALIMELRENSNVIINENYRRSTESVLNQFHPDVIKMKLTTSEKNGNGNAHNGNVEADQQQASPPSTTYFETLVHLFKGK